MKALLGAKGLPFAVYFKHYVQLFTSHLVWMDLQNINLSSLFPLCVVSQS